MTERAVSKDVDMREFANKKAFLTGAASGLGQALAVGLAERGVHCFLVDINEDGLRQTAEMVAERGVDVRTQLCDVRDSAQVRLTCQQAIRDCNGIDLLINNAGVMGIPRTLTEDGHEMQFGTNHLGHWTFTARLLPCLRAAGDARVVTVTSTAHHVGRAVDPDDIEMEKGYGDWKAYGRSKLANWHFGLGLNDLLAAEGWPVESLVAHPGLSDTDLQATSVETSDGKFLAKMFHSMASATGMSAARGALPQLRAATDPKAKGGEFYGPRWMNTGNPVKLPILRRLGMAGAIEKLWAVSEDLTGESILPE